jgi:hypothetical protein
MGEGQAMTHPIGDEPLDIPRFRERIAKYSDEHLLYCGRRRRRTWRALLLTTGRSWSRTSSSLRNCGRSGGGDIHALLGKRQVAKPGELFVPPV